MHIKENHVSNFGSKKQMNRKIGLIKVKALVDSTTQHNNASNNAINCQASEIASEIFEENIWRLYCLSQPHPFRLWLAALAFVCSLAIIE